MTITNGDIGVVLDFTINKPDATPYNLTGATVDLLVPGFAAKPCTLVSPSSGTCRLTTGSNEFGTVAANYAVKLRVNAVGGGVFHSSSFQISLVDP